MCDRELVNLVWDGENSAKKRNLMDKHCQPGCWCHTQIGNELILYTTYLYRIQSVQHRSLGVLMSAPALAPRIFNSCRMGRPPFLKSSRIRRGNVIFDWLCLEFFEASGPYLKSYQCSNTIVTSAGEFVRSGCWHLLGLRCIFDGRLES